MAETAGPGLGRREFVDPEGLKLRSQAARGLRSVWFAAEQVRLGRLVAVKYLHPFLAKSPAFLQAFLAAGRQAAGIVHPAALPIINVYPEQHCLAAQWCRGHSLSRLPAPLSPVKTAMVGEVVLDCLSSLHATDRCHGNLSPGNLFLGEEGGIWVEDFFQPPLMLDGERIFMTERRYVAPEVVHGGCSDWRSDVYSLGRVLAAVSDTSVRSEELGMLLDSMQADDPSHRGGSPEALLAAFRRVRRLEEVRTGQAADSVRRKRMYRRVPAEFEVSLRRRSATPEETASILMKTRDIGESGVFVETDDDMLKVGSILELDFTLKGIEGNIHAFGIVRWKSSPPMPTGVGVQFVEVDQAGLLRLRKFLGKG